MSFYVTYGDKTASFSTDCGLDDIQAYFGVTMGGLHRHGLGPVVSSKNIKSGEAYELQGSPIGVKILRKVHQKKYPSGITVIERIEWESEPEEEDRIISSEVPSGKPSSPRMTLSKRKRTKSTNNIRQAANNPSKVEQEASEFIKPINWMLVTVCSILIALLFFVCVNYLHSYDPNLELVLREDADQMTVVSLSIMTISLLFGVVAFFH